MALAGNTADFYITSTPSVSVTDQATTVMDASEGAPDDYYWYRVSNSARRFSDPTVTPVVERDTGGGYSTVDASEYEWQDCGGIVKFTAQQGASDAIRVDYNYLPVSQLGGAKEWSLDLDVDLLDSTAFQDSWKRKTPGVKDGAVSVSKWFLDGSLLDQLGTLLVVVLYTDYDNSLRYEAFAYMKSDSIKAAVDGLIEEELSLETHGDTYYATY